MSLIYSGLKPTQLIEHTGPLHPEGAFVYEDEAGLVKYILVENLQSDMLNKMGFDYQDFGVTSTSGTFTFTDAIPADAKDFLVFANGQLRYNVVSAVDQANKQITLTDSGTFDADIRIVFPRQV